MKIAELFEQMPNKKRTIRDLANYIKTKSGNAPNYSLFLGAGASVTSGINSGAQLVEEWRKEIYELLTQKTYTDVKETKNYLLDKQAIWYDPSNEYSSLFQKKFDLPTQRRRFVEEQVDSKLPSIGYSYMVNLFQSGFFDTVFTTNFDDLINEAFYQFSRERPTLCAHDSSIKGVSVNSSRPKIIKVHGDYLFDSIKSTLNETESLETNTREKLIEFTKKYGLIFIGYAGNDRSIIDVINHLLRQDEFLGNGIYWCFRPEDEINADLFKVIKKEKVYFVEIEGFDQALAELHYHINGEGLSLEANFKSTKRDSMLANFTEDKFQLSNNIYIAQDLARLKTHTNKIDISNLINELSGENYTNSKDFTEVDFKNLLALDTLIKNKKYDESEKEALKLLSFSSQDNMNKAYLSRLIVIYQQQNQNERAIEQVDKIIEMDEFSISSNIRKLSLIKNPLQKMEFIASLVDKFKYSSEIRNQYALESLEYRESKFYKNDIKIDDILEKLNESLKIDPSLDNRAWPLLHRAMEVNKDIKDNNKEYREELKKLIDRMCVMNPHHMRTLKMKMKLYLNEVDIDKVISLLDELDRIYIISSLKKQQEIFDLMITINRQLPSFRDRTKAYKTSRNFLEKYDFLFNKKDRSIYLVYKAEYLITYDRDLRQAKELILQSIDLDDISQNAQEAIEILLFDEPDEKNSRKLIDKCHLELDEETIYLMKSQIALDMQDYKQANELTELALNSGLNYITYLINQSFIYLSEGANQKAFNLLSTGIEQLPPGSDKDALIVNRELAHKRLKNKVNKVDIQNVYGRDKKGPASVSAHILLDEEVSARRLMDDIINNDFTYFYMFKRWPVIPQAYLTKYDEKIAYSQKISA